MRSKENMGCDMSGDYASLVERQNQKLQEQNHVLQQLKESKCFLLTVLDNSDISHPLLATSQGIVRGVNLFGLRLTLGEQVLCDEEGRILERKPHPGTGPLAVVKRVLGSGLYEVEEEGRTRAVAGGCSCERRGSGCFGFVIPCDCKDDPIFTGIAFKC